MTTTLTTNLRLQIVKHLAKAKSLDMVATITDLPRETVLDIASHHGYPDLERLNTAAQLLAAKAERENAAEHVQEGSAIPARVSPSLVQARQAFADVPAPGPADRPKDELRTLLNEGKAHPSKRIQAAANKVFDDIDRLRALIAEDAEKHSEKRKAAAEREAAKRRAAEEKAKARAEVERLEAQLRAAKAKLRGTAPKPAAGQQSSSDEHACGREDCGRSFATVQALRMHERRAHEGFDPNAAKGAA